MKRFLIVTMIALFAVPVAAEAWAARVKAVEGKGQVRTKVVVHPGFPIRRPAPVVVVRRRPVVVTQHIVYARPVMWRPLVVTLPPRDRLAWEDGETLWKSEGWTEFTLDVNGRGERLYLEFTGRTRLDWAEVVFGNGQAEVVDFGARTYHPGIYSLLDFRDGRTVRYVRLLARAQSRESRVIVRMQR